MNADWIKAFLLGIVVALLAVMVFGEGDKPLTNLFTAQASSGGASEGIIAFVGGNNNDRLFIVDAKNLRMATYDCESSSGKVLLKGARNFSLDLKITEDFNSKKGISAKDVKDAFRGK